MRTEGYRALENDRIARAGRSSWETRLLGRRAVVVRGQDGAALFYDESLVSRAGAVPSPLAALLFGSGAVHGLDGEEHRRRKEGFLDLLRPARTPELALDAGRRLAETLEQSDGTTPLHRQLVEAYGGAALAWAGFALPAHTAAAVSRELARIVDGFGFAVPAYPRAWAARLRTDHWLRRQVGAVRDDRCTAPADSPLAVLAAGDLPVRTAAVELGNLVRPTVAVSWLGTASARALAAHPEWRRRLREDPAARHAFAQEVRRTAPFVPALAGRVTRTVDHAGLRLRRGDRIVLDVRAVDHDPAIWAQPHLFRPERFLDRHPGPFEMLPQGGGAPQGHRCPGESLTLQLLAETLRVLARHRGELSAPGGPDLTRIPPPPDLGERVARRR